MEKNKNKRQFPQKSPDPPEWLTLGLALWVPGRCLPIPAFLWGRAGSGPHKGEKKCPAQEAEPPNTKGLLQSLLGPRPQPAPREPHRVMPPGTHPRQAHHPPALFYS